MKDIIKKTKYLLLIITGIVLIFSACANENNTSNIVAGKTIKATYQNAEHIFVFNEDGTVQVTIDNEKDFRCNYTQDGENVVIDVYGYIYNCTYDGTDFQIVSIGQADKDSEDIEDKDTLKYMHDGIEREYILYLPDDYADAPLVLVLHGFGGSAASSEQYMGFNDIAEENNFAVCYPQGIYGGDKEGTYWNANMKDGTDDIGFLSSLANDIVSEYGLDKESVFVCGFSNGGFMSYTLALHAQDTFKKAAVASGLMSEYDWNNKDSAAPMPVLHIHGADDSIIEIEDSVNYIMSVDEIIEFWVNKNGCTEVSETKLGEDTTVYRHYDSSTDNEVWYYKVSNFGHEWPTEEATDFNATDIVWEFFSN